MAYGLPVMVSMPGKTVPGSGIKGYDITIGDGAYIGSGSVITRDVPADALAIGRGQQVVKEGWARRLRDLKTANKKRTPAT